jgi:hypothetical protein
VYLEMTVRIREVTSIKRLGMTRRGISPNYSLISAIFGSPSTMFSYTVLTFVALATAPLTVFAGNEIVFVKQDVNFDDHPFVAPGPDDVRSPCPGLNTFVVFLQLCVKGKYTEVFHLLASPTTASSVMMARISAPPTFSRLP